MISSAPTDKRTVSLCATTSASAHVTSEKIRCVWQVPGVSSDLYSLVYSQVTSATRAHICLCNVDPNGFRCQPHAREYAHCCRVRLRHAISYAPVVVSRRCMKVLLLMTVSNHDDNMPMFR